MNLEPLAVCALFTGIPPQNYEEAAQCLKAVEKPFEAGAYLLHEGDAAGRIGVLLAGGAEVVRDGADGNRTVQAVLTPGDLFAETFAAAHLGVLPISVVATAKSTALFFSYSALVGHTGESCRWQGQLVQNLLGVLAQKNLVLNARLTHLGQRTLRGKLMSYLIAQSEAAGGKTFTIPLNRQVLADYLCADRSALSAELSRMQRDGLLYYRRNRFTLL